MIDTAAQARKEAVRRELAGMRQRTPLGAPRRNRRQETAYLAGREPRKMEREGRA